ncbi:hypothetical protein OtV6_202c [Ostreococcus tauri virus RT-2011]|nr:hypothetical protein OtV6_202c [Ostreococcus tauri virus RT-2011]
MHVKIIRSPDRKKKFRAILGDGRTVDFGASGYSDYTKHKTPSRMRSYVLRHGGRVPKRTIAERDPRRIQTMMLDVNSSDKEDWKISGIDGAGFWSRWYLWSYPNFEGVKKFMSKRFGIKFIN